MQQELIVSGARIKLLDAPKPIKPNYNVKQITLTPANRAVLTKHTSKINNVNQRQAYQVKVKNYTNSDVYNKQLKEIYEAIEFDDFKRFLVKNNRSLKKRVDAFDEYFDNFYKNNYEIHYNRLKDMLAASNKTATY